MFEDEPREERSFDGAVDRPVERPEPVERTERIERPDDPPLFARPDPVPPEPRQEPMRAERERTFFDGEPEHPMDRPVERHAARPAEPVADEEPEVPFYRKVLAHRHAEESGGFGPNWSNVDDYDIPTVLRKQMD